MHSPPMIVISECHSNQISTSSIVVTNSQFHLQPMDLDTSLLIYTTTDHDVDYITLSDVSITNTELYGGMSVINIGDICTDMYDIKFENISDELTGVIDGSELLGDEYVFINIDMDVNMG